MIANIILGVICLLFISFIPDKKKSLKIVFFLITFFLSIRYMWGNDYPEYLNNYNYFSSFNFGVFDVSSSGDLYKRNQYGWVILNRFFSSIGFGFFGMVIVLSIFENWVMYHVISKHVEPKFYWVAVFFYIFSTSFAVNASMMRQYFCICLYMLVMELMIDKKVRGYILWSIGLILFGTVFHTTNLVMLLTLPFFYIRFNSSKYSYFWMITIAVGFLLWNILGYNLMDSTIAMIMQNSEEYSSYEAYLEWENKGAVSGLGVIFRYLMFFVWLLLLPRFEERDKQIIIILGLVSYFLDVAVSVVPLATRFQAYFTILNMVRWAWLVQIAKRYKLLYLLFVAQIAITTREFVGFYYSDVWTDLTFHYQTIFSAGEWM